MTIFLHISFIEIVIGFNQVLYIISEGQGTTTLSVSVLSGMLAENRDVVVLLETKDDTAICKY